MSTTHSFLFDSNLRKDKHILTKQIFTQILINCFESFNNKKLDDD